MLTLDEIKQRLSQKNLSHVSDEIGISRQTISGIVNGHTEPKYKTVKALSDYLEGKTNG